MIAWTIGAALQSALFERVIVSTDDEEVARVSLEFGAEVPFLRQNYADDQSPVSLATVETVERLIGQGAKFDSVTQLFAACPLRTSQDIATAVMNFEVREVNFQISCFELGWMRPWWAVRLTAEKRPIPLFPEALLKRSQDLEALYCPTGATWIARTHALVSERTFYGKGHVYHPMPWQRSVDIDDPEDILMASVLFRSNNGFAG